MAYTGEIYLTICPAQQSTVLTACCHNKTFQIINFSNNTSNEFQIRLSYLATSVSCKIPFPPLAFPVMNIISNSTTVDESIKKHLQAY